MATVNLPIKAALLSFLIAAQRILGQGCDLQIQAGCLVAPKCEKNMEIMSLTLIWASQDGIEVMDPTSTQWSNPINPGQEVKFNTNGHKKFEVSI